MEGVFKSMIFGNLATVLWIKRQELASIVVSGKNAIRAAEEDVKRAAAISSDSYLDQTTLESTEEPSKPATDRAKIRLSVQDKAGTKQYRIYADDRFEQLFRKYAEKANIDEANLIFSFDGDKINPASTPMCLGMEDDDLIEVNEKQN